MLSPILILFVGLFILYKVMETLQTLLTYEKKHGQAQRFLAHIGNNFRWSSSMPERFLTPSEKSLSLSSNLTMRSELTSYLSSFENVVRLIIALLFLLCIINHS